MGDSVVIHLIRHEKTKGNMERKYVGWTDESIVNQNITCNIPIKTNVVYGSDLKRCYETSTLYFPTANFEGYPDLKELYFGDFEMKTYDELKDLPIYREWIDLPRTVTPPNGESFQNFEKRVLDCFQRIVNKKGEYVFIVHGGVIRLLLSKFLMDKDFQDIHAEHRTIYTLQWPNIQLFKGGVRCKRLSVVPITVNENM